MAQIIEANITVVMAGLLDKLGHALIEEFVKTGMPDDDANRIVRSLLSSYITQAKAHIRISDRELSTARLVEHLMVAAENRAVTHLMDSLHQNGFVTITTTKDEL